MKSSKLILALWLFCTIAVAQTLLQKQPVNSPVVAKPNAARAATPRSANGQPVNVPASQVAAPGTPSAAAPGLRVAASPTNFAAKPANNSRAKSAESFRRRRGTKAVKPTSAATALASGETRAPKAYKTRRDPFVSPVVEHIRNTAACSGSGRQCLVVGDISFHGVVSSPSGFIAVVMNGERTYFLRENDPLANGSVERITKDTIVLRERSSDALGRPLTREVTKRIGAPPV